MEIIHISRLRVGMYVQLEEGWFNHPFLLNRFKIKNQSQIEKLQKTGMQHLRWLPEKSDPDATMAVTSHTTDLPEPNLPGRRRRREGKADEEKLRVLIVEDDEDIVTLYDRCLPDPVFEKVMVRNGMKALEIYRSWNPDIIVLDIMLPIMDGYMVLKEIRDFVTDKDTCIIMATSLSQKQDIVYCAQIGIQGYLVKPFRPKEICEKVLKYFAKTDPERARDVRKRLQDYRQRNALGTESPPPATPHP